MCVCVCVYSCVLLLYRRKILVVLCSRTKKKKEDMETFKLEVEKKKANEQQKPTWLKDWKGNEN